MTIEKLAVFNKEIVIGNLQLPGHLFIPENSQGIVLFAHGSGSSRFSKRNMMVANSLQKNGIGTLLFDLLTREEEQDRQNVFDIEMLADRLEDARKWLINVIEYRGQPFGYFGASTGAAAALVAAARKPQGVKAVVSRGGRPDLAAALLDQVKAPTLLIVGGADEYVIELNKKAFDQLHCKKFIEIIPDATHLFSEPGALERVSTLACAWFLDNF
jgi:putative phosphoribosyl transferase